jgi:hypothetical protein
MFGEDEQLVKGFTDQPLLRYFEIFTPKLISKGVPGQYQGITLLEVSTEEFLGRFKYN